MENKFAVTATELLAYASKTLEEHGYRRVNLDLNHDWRTVNARLFEDDYAIVAIVVYETWKDLSSNWADAQALLVELISRYITSYDPKSWEGYLVLLTPSLVGKQDRSEIIRIRYDISRVRKLIATGDDIKTLEDVKQALLPLLPLQVETVEQVGESVLAILPNLLSKRGLPEQAIRVVVDAFLEQRPIVESLHNYRTENENKVD